MGSMPSSDSFAQTIAWSGEAVMGDGLSYGRKEHQFDFVQEPLDHLAWRSAPVLPRNDGHLTIFVRPEPRTKPD
jgi:hypothetical protein